MTYSIVVHSGKAVPLIPVYKPYLPPGSLAKAHDALDSTWLSSQGKYIKMAQEKLQELLNVKYALPLNNGTSACHLVAKCVNQFHTQRSGGKIRIIVPNNVYVAAWNAFLFDNRFELIPLKADLNTWNIDFNDLDEKINSWPEASVLIVHNIGNIVNIPELKRKYPNTLFVEDNCEGFLGTYNGLQSGTVSYCSAISFFGNKNITCGEGGAFVTNDEHAYLFAKCVQGQGQSAKRFIHAELGYNYRINNIQAAILCGQLDVLPEIIDRKNHIFMIYRHAFNARNDILIQNVDLTTTHSNWMFGVRVPGQKCYDIAETFFNTRGIEIRPMFYSIFTHDHLRNHPDISRADCINADLLQKECFILPSFPELTPIEMKYIIETTNKYIIENHKI